MMDQSQDVLEYDVAEAARIIQREDGVSERMALAGSRALSSTHPALFPLVRAWLHGEHPEFEFQGVTMALIQEKQGPSYRAAIATMSDLLENPDRVDAFKTYDFPIM